MAKRICILGRRFKKGNRAQTDCQSELLHKRNQLVEHMVPVNEMNSSPLLDSYRGEFHHHKYRNWVEIDLSIIRRNVEIIRRLIGPDRLLMPCVKGNAYGHGLVQAGLAAIQGGANRLCVAFVEEGIVLRRAGITVPIQVFFEPTPQDVSEWQEFDLIASLSSISIIPALASSLTEPIKVHIHVDTGLGFMLIQALEGFPCNQ